MILPDSANDAFGGRANFEVGPTATHTRRSLLRFNVGALSGQYSSINSVTVVLTTSANFTSGTASTEGANTVNMFSVSSANAGWAPGTGSTGGTFGAEDYNASTWNLRQQGTVTAGTGTAWAGSLGLGTAGTDYVNTILASQSFTNGLGAGVTFSFTVTGSAATALINDWVDGTNEGLFFQAASETLGTANRISFASAEGSASYRPQLLIDYNVVPEPGRALLVMAGLTFVGMRRRR